MEVGSEHFVVPARMLWGILFFATMYVVNVSLPVGTVLWSTRTYRNNLPHFSENRFLTFLRVVCRRHPSNTRAVREKATVHDNFERGKGRLRPPRFLSHGSMYMSRGNQFIDSKLNARRRRTTTSCHFPPDRRT
jgi:hypothetical protein